MSLLFLTWSLFKYHRIHHFQMWSTLCPILHLWYSHWNYFFYLVFVDVKFRSPFVMFFFVWLDLLIALTVIKFNLLHLIVDMLQFLINFTIYYLPSFFSAQIFVLGHTIFLSFKLFMLLNKINIMTCIYILYCDTLFPATLVHIQSIFGSHFFYLFLYF